MKILVLTPEIRSAVHRGIYAYTKTVLAGLKRLGHTTGLLTQAPYAFDSRAHLPLIINDLVFPHGLDWSAARASWINSTYRRNAVDVQNKFAHSPLEDGWQFLKTVDFFFNAPLFFDAQDFEGGLSWRSSRDWPARAINMIKKRTGEMYWDALDIDFVGDAGYEVVLTTSPVAIRSKSGRIKVVQTVHDLIPLEYPFTGDNPVAFLKGLRAGLQPAHHVIAVSNHTKRALMELMPDLLATISVIYQANPIELAEKKSPAPDHGADDRRDRTTPYFLFIGAVERRKNIERILTAFGMILLETDFNLIIAGAGDEDYIRRIGLREMSADEKCRVTYLGPVSDHRKMHLLKEARCLVFPSLSEGFGLPLIEAMSSGCPVISSRSGSLHEIGSDAVLYVENPYDAADLARCMLMLAQDSELAAALESKGLRRAETFTMDAFAERLDHWSRVNGVFDRSHGVMTTIDDTATSVAILPEA